MFGTTRWIYALFEAGEIAGVDRAMEELESVVRQIRQPQYTYVQAGFVTMRALLEGRFTEAEQLTLQVLTLGQRLQFRAPKASSACKCLCCVESRVVYTRLHRLLKCSCRSIRVPPGNQDLP